MDTPWHYRITGTAADGQTWVVEGTVVCDFVTASALALPAGFTQLTKGKAVFGQPGVGCRGPYSIIEMTIKAVVQ